MSKVKKRFAGYPTADVYEDDNGRKGRKKIQQLLWGDEFLQYEETDGDYVRVQVRVGEGSVTKKGWMKSGSIARERLLEATFVDIGQGDGCLLVMPDNRRYVIDAGKQDHMSRFLKWRFMFMKDRTDFEAAVITHPDADHYQGFDAVLSLKNAVFRNVYHNGLVERRGDHSLGEPVGSHLRVFPPIVTDQDLRQLLDGEKGKKSRKNYPDLLTKAANQTQPTAKFQMLSRADEYLPGCEADKNVVVQILGPVMEATEHDGTTVHGLRMFPGDDGKANNSKSKNGHSVVLRLTYGKVRMLLGGDLNIPAEELLLETLMDGAPLPPREQKRAREKYIKQAREKLEVDIAKSCHHGSADFSSLFLEVVNPVATVISSGDDGSYSHPRAETLGAIGVNSRGHRPLIFSTELARSTKDAMRNPREERSNLKNLHKEIAREKDPAVRRKREKDFFKLVDDTINRTVQTYGAIFVRSDGEKVVIAQKVERPAGGKHWDFYQLEPNADGELVFLSQHEEASEEPAASTLRGKKAIRPRS